MKGDLYAQGKNSHELKEVIDYMGKAPPALFLFLFFFMYNISPKLQDCKTDP